MNQWRLHAEVLSLHVSGLRNETCILSVHLVLSQRPRKAHGDANCSTVGPEPSNSAPSQEPWPEVSQESSNQVDYLMGQSLCLLYKGELLSIHVGAQVAASNAEMLERKKADAAERAAEDRRIAAYLHDKAAREQVGFWFSVRVLG